MYIIVQNEIPEGQIVHSHPSDVEEHDKDEQPVVDTARGNDEDVVDIITGVEDLGSDTITDDIVTIDCAAGSETSCTAISSGGNDITMETW